MTKLIRVALEFSRSELDDLVDHVDAIIPKLSKRERLLLLAIFSAAREHVSILVQPMGPDQPEPTLADLKEDILAAFVPTDTNADDNYVIVSRIMPGRISSSKPKPPHRVSQSGS